MELPTNHKKLWSAFTDGFNEGRGQMLKKVAEQQAEIERLRAALSRIQNMATISPGDVCPTSAAGMQILAIFGYADEVLQPPDADVEPWPDPEPQQTKCPHGDDPAECDACMRDSDHAYDCDREHRFFRR